MAMTDDVYRILIAVIVLIVGLGVFNAIFAQPELDGMAEQSAFALGEAIETAADLPFTDSEPGLDETSLYAVAPMRLGQPMDIFSGWTAAWTGRQPRYEIFYEKFPDDQPLSFFTTWTESYPWSGGMSNQLMFYGFMRYGLGTSLGRKIITAPVWLPIKGIYKGYKFFDSLPARLYHVMKGGKARFGVKNIARYLENHPEGFLSTKLKNHWAHMNANPSLYGKQVAQIQNFHSVNKIAEKAASSGKIETEFMEDFAEEYLSTGLVQKQNGKLGFDVSKMSKSDVKQLKAIRDNMPRKGFWKTAGEHLKDDYLSKSPLEQFDDLFETPPPNSYYWPKFKDMWKRNVNYKVTNYVKKTRVYRGVKKVRRFQASLIPAIKSGNDMTTIMSDDAGTLIKVSRENFMAFTPEEKLSFAKVLGESFDDEAKAIKLFDDILAEQKGKSPIIFIPKDTPMYEYQGLLNRLEKSDAVENMGNGKLFSQLDVGEGTLKADVLDFCNGKSMSYSRCSEFWNKGILKRYTKGGAGISGVTESLYGRAFREAAQDPDQIVKLSDVLSGTYEQKPIWNIVDIAKQRAKTKGTRFIMFDFGKYKNPFWHGAFTTQYAQEQQIANMEGNSDNSLILMKGAEATPIPLDEKVDGYEVKIYRPKPSVSEAFPVHAGTVMFRASIVEHPRYYSVSPCFGIAKDWKEPSETGKGTLFVKIDPLCEITQEDGVTIDQAATCANYCYATNDRIWGTIAEGSETNPVLASDPYALGMGTFVTAFAGCVALVTFKTAIPTPPTPAELKWCMKFGAVSGGLVVMGETAYHAFEDDCTDNNNNWGYWNYYLASDTLDWLETVGSWGLKKIAKEAGEEVIKKGAKEFAKPTLKTSLKRSVATDASLGPQLAGDMVLAWTNVGLTKHGISYEQILENQAECVWKRPRVIEETEEE